MELCRNALTILMLTEGDYSLAGLYALIFSDEKRNAAIDLMLSRCFVRPSRRNVWPKPLLASPTTSMGSSTTKMLSSVDYHCRAGAESVFTP